MRPVMKPLSREFIDSCRREEGRIIRGDNMTRIETFVDAAFAFAFTMLVISIDEIPKSPPELFELSRDIPAFVFSALIIGAVWLAHAKWSRTFGLQDSITVYLSLALVFLMLVERGLGDGGFESPRQRPLAEDLLPFDEGLKDPVIPDFEVAPASVCMAINQPSFSQMLDLSALVGEVNRGQGHDQDLTIDCGRPGDS